MGKQGTEPSLRLGLRRLFRFEPTEPVSRGDKRKKSVAHLAAQDQRMNRSTIDLIKELEQEAGNFTEVALAVGFESTTIFVFSSDPDRQQKLDDAVIQGGEPIGFFGYDFHNKLLSVQTRAVADADEEWVGGYLNALTETFRKLLKQSHKVTELTAQVRHEK
jgi:hypothetical protein